MSEMTAELAIYAALIQESNYAVPDITKLSADEIGNIWEEHYDEFYDAIYEFRSSGEETNLSAPHSRHYESEQVASETPFGWVSWTYWYGGGKHSNPEEIDWKEDAFFVDVTEKEITCIQRTFMKKSD